MTDARELIERIGAVAEAVGWQAGVGASEMAGMIVSTLYRKPDLIPHFMAEGSELLIEGTIGPDTGSLSMMTAKGEVVSAEQVRTARQARRVLLDAGARPATPEGGKE